MQLRPIVTDGCIRKSLKAGDLLVSLLAIGLYYDQKINLLAIGLYQKQCLVTYQTGFNFARHRMVLVTE